MTRPRTVSIALVRAEDIPEGAYVRRSDGKPWQWVYTTTVGGRTADDGDGNVDTIASRLDERYTVLRLSMDPHLLLPSTRAAGVTTLNLDRFTGSSEDYDDEYVVSRSYDLWEIQIIDEQEVPA